MSDIDMKKTNISPNRKTGSSQNLRDQVADAGAELACAASGGQMHPVIGLWPVNLREALREAVAAEGIRKVDQWTARYRLAAVGFPHETPGVDPFFNANRPEDLDRAAALAGRAAD